MEVKDISKLVGQTVKLEESADGNGTVCYQGELERMIVPGLYRICNPFVIDSNGNVYRDVGGWKSVSKKDYKEGRLVLV
ncbi:hypothetical protein KY342_01280 [Candidatus Woesearchaeota archaeon]|nr:hypothetical protein [Candidatus Woesearchaeota archaeon]